MRPNRWTALAVPVLALALSACGGSASGSGSGAASGSGTPTIGVDKVDGIGAVLVDDHGAALYTPDQEADGMIRCTGGCTGFWTPLPAGSPTTTANSVDGRVGDIRRPDGTRQVTYDGRPLYRFTEDGGAGKVTGDGFKDSFGGIRFTWRAVTTDGVSTGGKGSSDSGGGYGY
jgi:predicted lipoprotein with Yx(FWY)xxD motif